MSPSTTPDIFDTLLRGAHQVYTAEELKARLSSGKRLRVKLGMDPTAPDLHLGHTVVLRKLRQFQDAGHKAVLIIGDYTATIGDPTGKSKTRPMLTKDEVKANAQTYFEQAGKVLDLSFEKLEIRYNSEWLAPLTLADIIKLMSQMTVARMLERDTFAKRQAEGREIYLHELLYPLMQARDSVAIEADVELGGTDQTFNNLCGRDLQRAAGQMPQVVMVMPLLIGTDGKEKMSKSLGNYVGITDRPAEMFGKIMRIPDELMRSYFELLTDVPEDDIAAMTPTAPASEDTSPLPSPLTKGGLRGVSSPITEDKPSRDRKGAESSSKPTSMNPRDTKEELAKIIITMYHDATAAKAAADEFRRVHGGASTGGLPDDIPDVVIPADKITDGKISPIDLITEGLGEKSRGEARRIVAERGVKLNGTAIEDPHTPIAIKSGDILQRGKRRFVRLILV